MVKTRGEGRLFIISAPSGSGKTTLCNKLLKDKVGLIRSISVTTRSPRPDERNGIDYHFISKKRFEGMIKRREFLEYEENFGNFYGTPKRPIKNWLKEGKPILLSIDVKGAITVKKTYQKQSVMIFILPPSIAALKKRLRSRLAGTSDSISTRLKLAKKEMSCRGHYDYEIVNDKLANAYKRLKGIIISEIKKRQG